MLDLLIAVVFCWLFFRGVGLSLRIAWSAAKIVAWMLFVIALPMMVGCMIIAGGFLLLIPLALVAIAFGLLKACVRL